jgi:hypothetical protein
MTSLHTKTPWHIGTGNGEGSIFASTGRIRLENGGSTLYPIARIADTDETDRERILHLATQAPSLFDICVQPLLHDVQYVRPTWREAAANTLKNALVDTREITESWRQEGNEIFTEGKLQPILIGNSGWDEKEDGANLRLIANAPKLARLLRTTIKSEQDLTYLQWCDHAYQLISKIDPIFLPLKTASS